MIDPFTGTGIQIALRTGEIAAEAVFETMSSMNLHPTITEVEPGNRPRSDSIVDAVLARYSQSYEREFDNRMKTAGLLRVAAFSPLTAGVVATVLTRAPRLAGLIFRATRSGNHAGHAAD
jgi:flavin-dependent dehydrogenase